jgi:cytolysin-activating lysine-acyltransferase
MMVETAKAAELPLKLPESAPHTVSHMLGEIVWLMTQSPLHKHFALADLEWMVMPPILLRQFRLFHDKGRPVGVALWAFLSDDAEAKLSLSPVRIRPDEWKSGDRCWLIDLIAPLATTENKLTAAMLVDLQQTALKGQAIRFHRTDPATGKREVVLVGIKPWE